MAAVAAESSSSGQSRCTIWMFGESETETRKGEKRVGEEGWEKRGRERKGEGGREEGERVIEKEKRRERRIRRRMESM